jgi:hypothetical protein
MDDPVYRAFLQTAAEDAAATNADSDIVRLVPDPRTGDPPDTYHGLLSDVEHLEHARAGTPRVTTEPIRFRLYFPADYCRSLDPNLQFKVVTVHSPLYQPNVRGGTVCLGPQFSPGTRLRAVVEQFYRIASGRATATDHAFDPKVRDYFLDHIEEVRKLKARPLWRRPVSTRVSVRSINKSAGESRGDRP